VPRDTPPFAPEGRGDWSDPTIPTTGAMPPLHTPPTCRPVFFEFLDRRHQPRQELEAGLDRGAGPVRPEGKDQGFNVLASRKPRWNSREFVEYPKRLAARVLSGRPYQAPPRATR